MSLYLMTPQDDIAYIIFNLFDNLTTEFIVHPLVFHNRSSNWGNAA